MVKMSSFRNMWEDSPAFRVLMSLLSSITGIVVLWIGGKTITNEDIGGFTLACVVLGFVITFIVINRSTNKKISIGDAAIQILQEGAEIAKEDLIKIVQTQIDIADSLSSEIDEKDEIIENQKIFSNETVTILNGLLQEIFRKDDIKDIDTKTFRREKV